LRCGGAAAISWGFFCGAREDHRKLAIGIGGPDPSRMDPWAMF
jgi:hypothetical protein